MIKQLQTAISNAPNASERLRKPTRVEAVKLKVERSAFLFRGAPVAIGISALNAAITAWIAWGVVAPSAIIGWFVASTSLALLRIGIWLRFRFARPSARSMTRFASLHVIFMAANGMLWGAIAPIFAVYGLISHAFLPFIISGIVAAAVISAGASWRAVMAFNVPALLPLAVTYVIAAPEGGIAVGALVMLYLAATCFLAFMMQRMIDRSIILHTHNVALYDELKKQASDAQLVERRFRALVEASNDLTVIFSPDGDIVYASPSAHAILGFEPKVMVGMSTKDIVHEDDIAQFRSVGGKTLSRLGDGVDLSHICLRHADGTYVALSGRLTNMLYVPGVEGFVFNAAEQVDARKQPALLHAVT